MNDALITFDRVHKVFAPTRAGNEPVHAVNDVSFEIAPGEIFGVIGYSGAGKSTLVRLVNGLERPTSGSVVVDGHEVSAMSESQLRQVRPEIGMIFQQFNLFNAKTVAENIAYPLRLAKWSKADREQRVAELLEFVGLSDKAAVHPPQLSGGQKQRVGIARALATHPKILLADESTSALDPQTTREVLGLLRRANQRFGITIMVITHEMDVVRFLCDRVLVMDTGRAVEIGDVYSVFAAPQEPITRAFVGTALDDRPGAETLRRLSTTHPGRFVTVPVSDTHGGDRGLVFARHHVAAQIVYGSITEVAERPYGSLTYALTGAAADVDAAIAELAASGGVAELDLEEER